MKYPEFHHMTADDGCTLRYARWLADSHEKKGVMAVLPGRSEFIEKYAEVAGELLDRGFDVFILDWRGQGRSCRELANAHKGYVRSFDRYVSDLEAWMATCVIQAGDGPYYLLSHSMGGNVALRFLRLREQDLSGSIRAAVFTAPMMGLRTDPFPVPVAEMICRWWVGVGQGEAYAPGNGDYQANPVFEGNRLTADPERFYFFHDAIKKQPELALGGVTYRWLAEAFTSMRRLMEKGVPEKIHVPVLMISAGADTVVSNLRMSALAARLPRCRYVVIPGARHEILMEQDVYREQFWSCFDDFIARTAP
ncbi:MAG: alpha/beta hydrolase [Deltaproteobacteria bacterium]|nr:MAG: alpha/beta hydrolase [Deltaproteobacteria bacterium]